MHSETQNKTVPPLSDSYSKARGSALVAAGILILVDLGKLDLTKPVPILGLSIPEPSIVKLVFLLITIYSSFRMIIEWLEVDAARRSQIASRIEFLASVSFVVFVICWHLLQRFNLQEVAKIQLLPSLTMAGFGFYFGQTVGVGISSLRYVRSKDDALRLGLHRRPFAVRAVHNHILHLSLPLTIIIVMAQGFSHPLADIWAFLLFCPAFVGLAGGLIDFIELGGRHKDGTVKTRNSYVASLRRILDWHDTTYRLNGWDKTAPSRQSPFYDACQNGDIEKVKQLLPLQKSINLPETLGWTPLMIAVAQQHSNVVELLLEKGANPNAANFQGRTPLAFAARYGRKDLVHMLLRYGADPNFRDSFFCEPPLEIAAYFGHKQIVEALLKAGASPIEVGHMKISPLESAQYQQHGEIASILRQSIAKNKKP